MDSVGNAFMYTMNWNPSYSYSKLPDGYTTETLPVHWKVMLTKVEPEERGIPHLKDIHVNDVKVNFARKAISAAGLDRSFLENFNFSNVAIKTANAGEISFAKNWTWNKVEVVSDNNKPVQVSKSEDMKLTGQTF
jgi:hypothetical protein